MKKFIIFLFASLILCISVKAQDSTNSKLTFKQVYTDFKDGGKDIIQGVKELASKLEGPAKHIYHVYINQHKTIGLTKGISTMFFLLLFGIITISAYRKADFGENDWNRQATLFLVGCVGSFIILLCTAFYLGNDFQQLINPEYYAIQDVIKAFK